MAVPHSVSSFFWHCPAWAPVGDQYIRSFRFHVCWIIRIISSAEPLCEEYREGNNLSPLPSWSNWDHQRIKTLVGLEIVSWSPTSCSQLVCCCCRDLRIPFSWRHTAVVPALLAWAGCIAACGTLYMGQVYVQWYVFAHKQAAARRSRYPYDLHRSWASLFFPKTYKSFPCHLPQNATLYHETLNGHHRPASSLGMRRWDKLPAHIQGPHCTPVLWVRSRLWSYTAHYNEHDLANVLLQHI